MARIGKVGRGPARPSTAISRRVLLGSAWPSGAMRGTARLGPAGLGCPRRGGARQSKANQQRRKGYTEMLIEVTIEGTSPLICNKFTDAAAQSATEGTRLAVQGDRGTPLEQATTKLYVSSDGETLMIPQPNLFSCIIEAGKFHKAGKSKLTTQKSSLIPACLAILGVELPITSREGWTVDTRAVRIPSTGGRILCHRPIFNDWALSFTLDLDTAFMAAKVCRQVVDDAGKRIGLGDFRPACKGPYGRFVVTSWKETKDDDAEAEAS